MARTRRGSKAKRKELHEVGLRSLPSYEEVLSTFRRYDLDLNGVLDFRELHGLMVDLNGQVGIKWTEVQTERLFAKLDRNHNGSVDINEFLDYIFEPDPESGTIGDAGKSDYQLVLQDFRKFDANHNGTLDRAEFTKLMGTLASHNGGWDAARTEAIFKEVDADHSGEVDINELLAFLFGVPGGKTGVAQAEQWTHQRHHFHHPLGHGQDQHHHLDAREIERSALVVVEFLVGPGGPETFIRQIAAVWQKDFGHDVVVKKRVDHNVKGFVRVSARNGAIVFWDAGKMAPYRENPFLNLGSMRKWLDAMSQRELPQLLKAARQMQARDRQSPPPPCSSWQPSWRMRATGVAALGAAAQAAA